jgi:hypothetical protein
VPREGERPLRARKTTKEDPFLQAFRIAAAHRGTPVARVEGDTATLLIGGVHQDVSLAEPRAACEGVFPGDRRRVIEDYLTAFASISGTARKETFAEVRDRILPRVGPAMPGGEAWAAIPLVPGFLDLFFVADEPERMRYLAGADLSEWGIRLTDLLPLAVRNLRARTDWRLLRWTDEPRGVGIYPPVDAFVAARMLLLRDALRPWPDPGAIVAAPERSVLAIAPIGGRKTLAHLDDIARAAGRAAPRRGLPVTADLLWFDGATWERIPVSHDRGDSETKPTQRLLEAVGGGPSAAGLSALSGV